MYTTTLSIVGLQVQLNLSESSGIPKVCYRYVISSKTALKYI